MQRGVVKFFSPEKGFGFIVPDGGGADVFFHRTTLPTGTLGAIQEGEPVLYEVEETKRGSRAKRVVFGGSGASQ